MVVVIINTIIIVVCNFYVVVVIRTNVCLAHSENRGRKKRGWSETTDESEGDFLSILNAYMDRFC